MWRRNPMMITVAKQPPLMEDLRSHSQEQLAELRLLLIGCAPTRPDPRRPGFYEIDGQTTTYYIFKYPTGTKVLLLAAWERENDPVAEMVACSCPAA
jgi:hypothetical protein